MFHQKCLHTGLVLKVEQMGKDHRVLSPLSLLKVTTKNNILPKYEEEFILKPQQTALLVYLSSESNCHHLAKNLI